jgi:hypothetical protein
MDDRMTFKLRDADPTLRMFLSAFLVVLTAGYSIGLLFVEHTTAVSSAGIQAQMLGNENVPGTEEVRYAKSLNEMYVFLHNHILSVSMMLAAVGAIFYFSSIASDRWKRFLLVEPFVAVTTTFGGIALVRFVSPHFSWLVFLSGISLFVCYGTMLILIMVELWMRSVVRKK